ncbi:hypothetical protein BpHYR1_024611 [Brachionus plicatilis]|uniref:Uncharacterized protein n=1 Tax=Brachionus plicatilis TaxID=10195 RepID=A0A3M7SR29_BRAPC|nr:hypothetical protein BpHYR1_024611 [Brachionus plicatilis]
MLQHTIALKKFKFLFGTEKRFFAVFANNQNRPVLISFGDPKFGKKVIIYYRLIEALIAKIIK